MSMSQPGFSKERKVGREQTKEREVQGTGDGNNPQKEEGWGSKGTENLVQRL